MLVEQHLLTILFLQELVTRQHPYNDLNQFQATSAIVRGDKPVWPPVSKGPNFLSDLDMYDYQILKDVCVSSWSYCGSRRPQMKTIRQRLMYGAIVDMTREEFYDSLTEWLAKHEARPNFDNLHIGSQTIDLLSLFVKVMEHGGVSRASHLLISALTLSLNHKRLDGTVQFLD